MELFLYTIIEISLKFMIMFCNISIYKTKNLLLLVLSVLQIRKIYEKKMMITEKLIKTE